jgi:phosphonate transport system permease protein
MMLALGGITPQAIRHARQVAPGAFERPAHWYLSRWGVAAVLLSLLAYGLVRFDFSPTRLINGLGQLGMIVQHMFPPQTGGALREYAWAMAETLAMAFLGTLIAAIVAVPVSLLASKNVFRFGVARFFVRRSMDMLRGVDQLIWAVIFVRAVGLGPLAGIMAIIVSDIGTLAKLFSESVENVDRRPIEGVRAAGGGPLQTIRYGLSPQVLPMFLSSALYMFESNTRSATILGIVGAGGIGYQLSERIRAHRWEEACLILIIILVTVAIIDLLSKWLRHRLIHGHQPQT